MSIFHKYPYTNMHEINLDWVISMIKELDHEMDEFKVVNEIHFEGEWDIQKAYQRWNLVDVNGFGYIAIKPVPIGVNITNENYWRLVANYSAIYADFQNRVIALEEKIDDLYVMPEYFGAVGDGIADDTEALNNAIATGKKVIGKKSSIYRITEPVSLSYFNGNHSKILLDFEDSKGVTVSEYLGYCEIIGSGNIEFVVYVNDTSNNTVIEGCYIHDFTDLSHGEVCGILINDLTNANHMVSVRNNVIKNLYAATVNSLAVANGISTYTKSNLEICNNVIQNIVSHNDVGVNNDGEGISIIISPSVEPNKYITSIHDNQIIGCTNGAIKNAANNADIYNNYINKDGYDFVNESAFTGNYGIRLQSKGCSIRNNKFIHTGTIAAIYIYGESHAGTGAHVIDNNEFLNTESYDYIDIREDNVKIVNTSITTSDVSHPAIYSEDSNLIMDKCMIVASIELRACKLLHSVVTGDVSFTGRFTLINDTISGNVNTTLGVLSDILIDMCEITGFVNIKTCNKLTISNSIINSSTYAIACDNITRAYISNNDITYSGSSGISLSITNVNAINNEFTGTGNAIDGPYSTKSIVTNNVLNGCSINVGAGSVTANNIAA